MNPDESADPINSSTTHPTGRRIRVRSIRKSSIDLPEARLPSIPSDDNNEDWVSPFTLPPLPSLKRNRPQADRSPQDRLHNRSGSSAYYAAAWGSPYATPSPNRSPANFPPRNRSLDLDSSSPVAIRKSVVPRSLRARKLSLPYEDSISPFSVRDAADAARSDDPQAQRRIWLSESEESDAEIDKTRTPTSTLPSSAARSHRLRESLDTITPETFSGSSSARVKFRLSPDKTMAETEIDSETMPLPSPDHDSVEKPLPELPPRDELAEKVEPLSQSRPTLPPQMQSFQRPKKKVPWKGKSCIIALPLTDREQAGLPPLLTKDEIRRRLQKFIDDGYPVDGFSVGAWNSIFGGGASRPLFPDQADMDFERKTSRINVHVPNLAEWNAWVEHLKEEKLRALGVTPSVSEAPPSTVSPFSSTMSRVSSAYPSMATSPPLPTLSAASNQRMAHSPFSPPLSIPSLSNFNLGSARATPQAGMQRPMHGYNQSMALPSTFQRIGSPFDYLSSQPMRSPLEQSRRPFSPGHVQNLQSMGHILSPLGTGLPDFSRNASSHPQIEQIRRQKEMLAQQQQLVQEQIARHHHQRQMSMFPLQSQSVEPLPRTPVMQSPPRKTPEIMHPTPRSHRHNLSEALEQGVTDSIREAAEKIQESTNTTTTTTSTAKVEESVGEDVPPEEDNAPEESTVEEELPILQRPETIKETDEKDEIETNPSIAGTPLLLEDSNPFANFKPLPPVKPAAQAHSTRSSLASKPGHSAQPSLSKLNVQAKEFNPSGMFSGSNFNFGHKPAIPSLSSAAVPSFPPWQPSHKANVSSLSKLNVTAKEFTPMTLSHQESAQPFTFGSSAQKSVTPDPSIDATPEKPAFDPRSSTFSFSSATFNVEAPEFKPSHSADGSINPLASEKVQDFKSSIFGDVVIEPSTKVMRRGASKALPIVRPTSKQSQTPEPTAEASDDSGRPERLDDRQKRARTVDTEGDDELSFAASAPFTSLADKAEDLVVAESSVEADIKDEAETKLGEKAEDGSQNNLEESATNTEPVSATQDHRSTKRSNEDNAQEEESHQFSDPVQPDEKDQAPRASKPKSMPIRSGKDILAAALSEAVAKNAAPLPERKAAIAPVEPESTNAERTPTEQTDEREDGTVKTLDFAISSPVENPETKDNSHSTATVADAISGSPSAGAMAPQTHQSSAPEQKSALSAAAEPFVFKPFASEFVPVPVKEPSSQAPKVQPQPTKPKKAQGLMASRFASSPTPDTTSEPPAQSALPSATTIDDKQTGFATDSHTKSTTSMDRSSRNNVTADDERIEPKEVLVSSSPRMIKEEQQTSPMLPVDQEPGNARTESIDQGGPSIEEINAVMKQFEEDPDLGVIREDTPVRSTPLIDMRLPQHFRSDAPSPSPRRLDQPFEEREQRSFNGLGFELSGVHQLNYGSGDISDWNADIDLSPGQQDKLEARAHFFDDHVNDLVDNILESRLAPLENMLQAVHETMAAVAGKQRHGGRTSSSTLQKDSDADDEDDYDAYEGYAHYRSKSPQKRSGRREEMLKNAVAEALEAHQSQAIQQSATDLQALQETVEHVKQWTQQRAQQESTAVEKDDLRAFLSDLRTATQREREPPSEIVAMKSALDELRQMSLARADQPSFDASSLQQMLEEIRQSAKNPSQAEEREQPDLKAVLAEVIDSHPRFQEAPKSDDSEMSQKWQLKIDNLESMLKVAEKRADGEAALRREAEDEIEILSRNLKDAQESVNSHKDASAEAKKSLESFLKEKQSYHEITPELQNLRLKNAELEKTLDEYRLSRDQWREDIREERAKNKDLMRTLQEVREQYEDRLESRQMLREQIDRVQQRMTKVMEDVQHDQAEWRKRELDLAGKNQLLQSALDHETHRRARIELDADKISKEHKESLQFRTKHEYAQDEIARLAGIIVGLQAENRSHQDTSHKMERELKENDASTSRLTDGLRSELDLARRSLDDVQAHADAQVARLQTRLRAVEGDLQEEKSKHKELLETTFQAHNQSLREVNEKHESELKDLEAVHENKLDELRKQHTRALHNSSEDMHRLEQHLNEKLNIRDDQVKHLSGKITDLEERLEVTRAAARAAVEAASAKGANLPTPASSVVASPPHRPSISASMPLAKGSELPEKISPQALRESIMVLQDQLQAREQEIEKLESEIAAIDKEAPAKVKERDTEITMLRELLDVRIDDLQELINTLEKPHYDRNAVKDAAIRLKTQIRMEQQLKERAISGATLASKLPSSIASGLTNLASSPRAMVAAAAWGNWRKVRDNSVSAVADFATNVGSQTPSRSSSTSSGFLSGMLTPPPSMQPQRTPINASRTQQRARPLAAAAATRTGNVQRNVPEARPLRAFSSQPRSLAKRGSDSRPGSSGSVMRSLEPSSTRVEPPSTPLHLKTDSDFGDDIDDDASPLDGRDQGFGTEEDEHSYEEPVSPKLTMSSPQRRRLAAQHLEAQLEDDETVQVLEETDY